MTIPAHPSSAALERLLAPVRLLPVLTIDTPADGEALAAALHAAGLPLIEVTLRTPAALDVVRTVKRALPAVTVGVGTVLDPDTLARAGDAGADFAVSPGLTPALLEAATKGPVPLLPGIATPSDILLGRSFGLTLFKFFPAEPYGGIPVLKALAGPFADIRFVPTGGITAETAAEYLALSNVVCVGGSWMAPKDLVKRAAWDDLRRTAEESLAKLQKA